jgi:hypothetical protein
VKAWEAFDVETVGRTSEILYALAKELITQRRAMPLDPEEDPVSSLLQARDGKGAPLPADMLVGCVRQILVVGLVAPPVFLGSVAVHLARDTSLQAKLRAEPDLIAPACEEFLRLYTPYRGFARTSVSGATFNGIAIGPDEPIALAYASANRDEAIFPDPDTFRLDRPNIREHLAFGRGRIAVPAWHWPGSSCRSRCANCSRRPETLLLPARSVWQGCRKSVPFMYRSSSTERSFRDASHSSFARTTSERFAVQSMPLTERSSPFQANSSIPCHGFILAPRIRPRLTRRPACHRYDALPQGSLLGTWR